MTVSAAIPVAGIARGGTAVCDGAFACGELCVLAHPAKLRTKEALHRSVWGSELLKWS